LCCTKNMLLANIESVAEKACLARELQSLIFLSVLILINARTVRVTDFSLTGNDFWTSGSSGRCNSSYSWCAHDEWVDFDTLDAVPPETKQFNQCLFVSLENSEGQNMTSLKLKSSDCMQKRRAICVVRTNLAN
jgi:hypothetical protein